MPEKSQIEAMRAAVRGDLERARARREADPWREPEPLPEAMPGPTLEAEAEPQPELEPLRRADVLPDAKPEPELAVPPEPEPAAPPEPEPDPSRPGLFARLFGRG